MVVTLVHASGRVVLCPPHSELVHPSSYLSSDHTRLSIIKTFIASTIFPEADSFSSHVGAVQISRFTPGSTYEKLAELECDTAMTMPIDAAKGLGMSTDSLSPFQTKPSGSLAKGSTQASRCLFLYDRALRFARHSNYKGARRTFQTCTSLNPDFSKAWVSWAQMEKRTAFTGNGDNIERCRKVLQKGLSLNPTDAKLLQAWGLMELQRGNVLAAVLLLERCVRFDPSCRPVLQWRIVQAAKQAVSQRMQRQLESQMDAAKEIANSLQDALQVQPETES